uniref:Uncharacterized protein n=1 Tax=Cannabis sativa TaxID=3483 RepID=A0A803QSF7_CANSA
MIKKRMFKPLDDRWCPVGKFLTNTTFDFDAMRYVGFTLAYREDPRMVPQDELDMWVQPRFEGLNGYAPTVMRMKEWLSARTRDRVMWMPWKLIPRMVRSDGGNSVMRMGVNQGVIPRESGSDIVVNYENCGNKTISARKSLALRALLFTAGEGHRGRVEALGRKEGMQVLRENYKKVEAWLLEVLIQKKCFGQRSKQLWLKEGDQNSKYFYAMATSRKRNNSIQRLKNDHGIWIDWENNLPNLMVDYFNNLFTSSSLDVNEVTDTIPRVITEDQNGLLLEPISDDEVRRALFQMNPDKSPGPDGMTPRFFSKMLVRGGK